MNYLQAPRLELLIERYVLGTMSRRARRRFARILDEASDARALQLALESRLAPLGSSVAPVNPSGLVWQRIARELQFGKRHRPASQVPRWSVAASMLLAIGLTVVSIGWWKAMHRPPEVMVETVRELVPDAASVAVVHDASGKPIWVARVYLASERLELRVNTPPESVAEKDYELWALMDDGTPVSLGLLPKSGADTRTLDARAMASIRRSSMLAVSLEPAGGSPQPVPTGPVLYTAALLAP
jgi:anti-sigma-K factor RskA